MTRYCPPNCCSVCLLPMPQPVTDRGPVLHNRKNRAPKLPPNHRVTNASFCKSLRIRHMQTAWGYRPKILSKCSNGIAAGDRPFHQRTRPHGRLNESSDQKSGARPRRHNHAATTLCRLQRKNYSAKANRKRPSQRFPFWTSQRTALYIKLLFGCRCLLHGFAHTTSGLAAVFTASGTFSGVHSYGCGLDFGSAQYGYGLYLEPAQLTGAGCTCSPRN